MYSNKGYIMKTGLKLLIITSSILVATTVTAMEKQYFIGADFISSQADGKYGLAGTVTRDGVSYTGLEGSVDDSASTVGVKVGVIIDNTNKFSVHYDKTSFSSGGVDLDMKLYTVKYNYLLGEVNNFTPFIGAHIGMENTEAWGFSDTKPFYGIQIGTTYAIGDNFEFEIGLSYSMLNAKPETYSVSGTSSDGSVTLTNASLYVQSETMLKSYIGVNYKF